MSFTQISAAFYSSLKLSAIILAAALSTHVVSGEAYKWVDAQGNTHYSDKKPNHTESKSIRISNSKPSSRPSPQGQAKALDEQAARAAQAKNEVAQDEARKKEVAQKCKAIRDNLKVIAETSRIRIEDEGKLRYLTPEEIASKKARHEEQLKEFCE